MGKQELPQVGDVLVSRRFVGMVFQYDIPPRWFPMPVGQMSARQRKAFDIRTRRLSEDERVRMAAASGKIPPETVEEIIGERVTDRAARFVVEEAKMDGGGTGHGPHDVYPDGWHVVARLLNADGTYNPGGPKISFYMTGCFIGMVKPEEIDIVARMGRRFE